MGDQLAGQLPANSTQCPVERQKHSDQPNTVHPLERQRTMPAAFIANRNLSQIESLLRPTTLGHSAAARYRITQRHFSGFRRLSARGKAEKESCAHSERTLEFWNNPDSPNTFSAAKLALLGSTNCKVDFGADNDQPQPGTTTGMLQKQNTVCLTVAMFDLRSSALSPKRSHSKKETRIRGSRDSIRQIVAGYFSISK